MKLTRLGDAPIVGPETPVRGVGPPIGANIQGPSLIRTPEWIDNPLGAYSLYFADHKGGYIRLAHADTVTGPWTVFAPGSLQLTDSTLITEPPGATPEQLSELEALYTKHLGATKASVVLVDATTPHIASPDVHIDTEHKRVVMYSHGVARLDVQLTTVATSTDGINFTGQSEVLGRPDMRAFEHAGMTDALAMPPNRSCGQPLTSTETGRRGPHRTLRSIGRSGQLVGVITDGTSGARTTTGIR